MRKCWCGNGDLILFSSEYALCQGCRTLVSRNSLPDDQLFVNNDDNDFYGKQYWLKHQSQNLGFPDIYTRIRSDLAERNLHWLKTLLRYRLPPGKVLELGCSHGSFVALLAQAGYAASGVEMSPWVVEFSKKSFGVPIFLGPIEGLNIAPGSLDVIALMDVLEHLPDPVATMDHCLKLLKPDGLLLIQTPQFIEEMDYGTLIATKGAFLEQLKADEHLYLFSRQAIARLFRQIGAEYIRFEPAIFSQYDMFFAVSRRELVTFSLDDAESAIMATPKGRVVLAMLDMDTRIKDLERQMKILEADRASRLHQIIALTEMVHEKDRQISIIEADREDRLSQISKLTDLINQLKK